MLKKVLFKIVVGIFFMAALIGLVIGIGWLLLTQIYGLPLVVYLLAVYIFLLVVVVAYDIGERVIRGVCA